MGLLPKKTLGRHFWTVGIVVSLGLYCWLLATVDVKFSYLSFQEVYGVRAQFKNSYAEAGLLPYFLPFTYAAFNPLLISYGIRNRQIPKVLLGALGQLLIYQASGLKLAILSIPLIALLAWMTSEKRRKRSAWRLPVFLSLVLLASRLMDQLTNSVMWTAVLVVRLIAIPGVLTTGYVEFFEQRPRMNFSDVLPGVEAPYTESPYVLVGEYLFNTTGTNANVNFFGDGYMNMGYLGVFVEVAFVIVLFRLADEASMDIPLPLACAIFAIPFISLTNGGAFTALLTYGFLPAILTARFATQLFDSPREVSDQESLARVGSVESA
jgi:hypothetical protein